MMLCGYNELDVYNLMDFVDDYKIIGWDFFFQFQHFPYVMGVYENKCA